MNVAGINRDYLLARDSEHHFNRSMASAAIECGKYISPTGTDIAEAGPEWKKPKSEDNDFTYGVLCEDGTRHEWKVVDNGFHEGAVFSADGKILSTWTDRPALPKMEVEELEVINIELSDYPLPENPTTYDWWWA